MSQFGSVTPFSRIVRSEQQHVNALSQLFTKYGLPVPANPGLVPAPTFANLQAASLKNHLPAFDACK